jgi:hypothetical protein
VPNATVSARFELTQENCKDRETQEIMIILGYMMHEDEDAHLAQNFEANKNGYYLQALADSLLG